MRATLTGLAFAGALSSRLLSKCRCRSGRRGSHKSGCNRRFNSARGAVLRASYPARYHQVLPGIRRGASRLPPLPSLVVVKPGAHRRVLWTIAAKSTVNNERNPITENGVRSTARDRARSLALLE